MFTLGPEVMAVGGLVHFDGTGQHFGKCGRDGHTAAGVLERMIAVLKNTVETAGESAVNENERKNE